MQDSNKSNTLLRNLLRPNTVYNVDGITDLKYIISTKKDIICELYEMNFGLKKIEKKIYKPICVSSVQNTNNMVYDLYNKGGINLKNIVNGKDENGVQRLLINDLHANNIYVHTNDSSRFAKVTILKYSAPLFEEYIYQYNNNEKTIILNEKQSFANIYYSLNPINYPNQYENKVVTKYTGKRINKGECKSHTFNEPYLQSDNQIKRVMRYKKYLQNQTLPKLQNIAKNKDVKYTKKKDGKTIDIKKSSLIEKLSKELLRTKI